MAENKVIQGGMSGVPAWMDIMISDDGMKASLLLKSGGEAAFFTPEEVKDHLRKAGIQVAVKDEVIRQMIQERLFDNYYLIAEGESPRPGKNGYYEYFFNTNAQTGIPRILPNGKVDYSQIIELVNEGDVIARYHSAKEGQNGCRVNGEIIKPEKVHDEAALTLQGVKKEDGKYIALSDGRVTLKNHRLKVDPALNVRGDVNHTFGNVKFNGDVFVKGDIRSGMTVEAAGSVIIDGTVEGAHINAGGDIIVGYGIQGEGKALIESGGSLTCSFIEAAVVVTTGDICTGSIVNSNVYSDGSIDVTAEDKGIIMGGVVCGMTGVKANMAGHRSGIHTEIYVGASLEDTAIIRKLQRSIRSCMSYAERIEKEEQDLTIQMKKEGNTVRGTRIKKRVKMVAEEKIQLGINIGKSNWELNRILNRIAYAKDAIAIVNYKIYEGVDIIVGTVQAEIPDDIEGARFVKNGDIVDVNPFVKARRKK